MSVVQKTEGRMLNLMRTFYDKMKKRYFLCRDGKLYITKLVMISRTENKG